ncbi:hypothetical protein DFH27DRAFT_315039 [Peziza echinospora]|nr:hypothetical protein DFH27DRAFT_315039 [Peziza echinospora]
MDIDHGHAYAYHASNFFFSRSSLIFYSLILSSLFLFFFCPRMEGRVGVTNLIFKHFLLVHVFYIYNMLAFVVFFIFCFSVFFFFFVFLLLLLVYSRSSIFDQIVLRGREREREREDLDLLAKI